MTSGPMFHLAVFLFFSLARSLAYSLPIPRSSLGCNIHFTSPPSLPHPICTLTIPRPSLLLIQHIQYHTHNTHQARSHAPILSLSHRILLYYTVIHSPLPHLDLCSVFPFRSFPFPFFVSSFRFVSTMLPAFHSILFLSFFTLCSRFCRPSFDLCSLTLFHSPSPFSSLTVCFHGIANIWNLGNAVVQKPRN